MNITLGISVNIAHAHKHAHAHDTLGKNDFIVATEPQVLVVGLLACHYIYNTAMNKDAKPSKLKLCVFMTAMAIQSATATRVATYVTDQK